MEGQKRPDGLFWIGLFLGGVIGALIIVLMGTDKGKKLLRQLQDDSEDFFEHKRSDIEKKVAQLEQKGAELIEQGKAIQEEVMDSVRETKSEVSKDAAERVDEALSHIEALQERGRKNTADLRKRLFKNIPKK
ncbi:hypothetical protein C4579_00440 [Candidatus Microgenomates bacterium]|nr:MAG: hypothetical protein C4579_00440 [Candidatus Microgenomates bacterium]